MKEFLKEIEEYLYYCKYQKRLEEKTIAAYRNDLMQFENYANKLCEDKIDKESIKKYVIYLHSHYKQKSVKRKIASIKAFYNYLEMEELINYNPMHNVNTKFKEEKILPRTIPMYVIESLLNCMYNIRNDNRESEWKNKILIRDIAIIELLFSTGMRISELCNLRDQEFDLSDGKLCIKGKGSKERYLQIENDEIIALFKEYRNNFIQSIKTSGFFFVNRYGGRLSEQSARKMLYKYLNLAKLEMHITPHMFRHAFATLLLEEDVDIRYIQKMLGHSSIVTTQIYTNVAMKKQGEILRGKAS
jgi:integrase/recombinase XerD